MALLSNPKKLVKQKFPGAFCQMVSRAPVRYQVWVEVQNPGEQENRKWESEAPTAAWLKAAKELGLVDEHGREL